MLGTPDIDSWSGASSYFASIVQSSSQSGDAMLSDTLQNAGACCVFFFFCEVGDIESEPFSSTDASEK